MGETNINNSDSQLQRLYEWLTDKNREPAQTKFTASWLRNVAKEIEFRLQSVASTDYLYLLHKDDLINLVKGIVPYYSLFDDPLVKSTGNYIGGMNDRWSWRESDLKELDEKQLWKLYKMCKESWK